MYAFRRKLWVNLHALRVGMITKHNNRWVYINTIEGMRPGALTRRAVVTPMFRLRKIGGMVVHFPDAPRRVLISSLINSRQIITTSAPTTVRGDVHNSISDGARGRVTQTDNTDGQTVSDFLKDQ